MPSPPRPKTVDEISRTKLRILRRRLGLEPKSNWTEGKKFDSDKVRVELLPVRPQLAEAEVLTFGAKKYDDRNWEKGILWSRCYGAALRHLFAWWNGQDLDPETNLSHLAHARCCISFLLEYEETHRELDNRPKRSGSQGASTLPPEASPTLATHVQ